MREGVPRRTGSLALASLHEEWPPRKELVAAAVVEVQVRINDETDVLRRETEAGEGFLKRVADGFVEPVDELVRRADAGVHEHRTIRVIDEERENGSGLAVARVALGIDKVSDAKCVDRGRRR